MQIGLYMYVKPIKWNKTINVVCGEESKSAGELYFTARTGSNGRHVVFIQYYWGNNDD